MHFFLLQVNLKMREITEKEVKLKQQLLESPAHQKVKGALNAPGTRLVRLAVVTKFVRVRHLLPLFVLGPEGVPRSPPSGPGGGRDRVLLFRPCTGVALYLTGEGEGEVGRIEARGGGAYGTTRELASRFTKRGENCLLSRVPLKTASVPREVQRSRWCASASLRGLQADGCGNDTGGALRVLVISVLFFPWDSGFWPSGCVTESPSPKCA